MMFGPHDSNSTHSEMSMKWKIKRFSNDGLRQKFLDATVPQAQYLGLTIPDPDLRFDEASGHWEHGAIDWDEFQRVLAGDGPCNASASSIAGGPRPTAPGCAKPQPPTPPSSARRPGAPLEALIEDFDE